MTKYKFIVTHYNISDKGQVFVWGCNKYGQCTQSPEVITQVNTPYMVNQEMFNNRKVVAVKSGWTHVIAQTGMFDFCQTFKYTLTFIIESPVFKMDKM